MHAVNKGQVWTWEVDQILVMQVKLTLKGEGIVALRGGNSRCKSLVTAVSVDCQQTVGSVCECTMLPNITQQNSKD